MKVKNNRQNFVVLQVKNGFSTEIFNLSPLEEVTIPYLNSLDQVMNRFLFNIGNLSLVADEIVEEKSEPIIVTKPVRQSKLDKAIKSADDFVSSANKEEKIKQ